MKNNRLFSFVIVLISYIVAIIAGIYSYTLFKFDFWLNLLLADIIATIVIFIFSVIFNNASIYDPYWSVQPIAIVIAYACVYGVNPVTMLAIIAISLWGIRLTINWAYTFKSLNHQDWRYSMLKEKTKGFYPIVNLLGIHMFPTIIVYLCVIPVAFLFMNDAKINAFTIIFFILAVVAFTIQGIADYQMHKFRKNKNSVFIRNGLWKNSRHPNYLGEILMWWAIGLLAVLSMMNHFYLLVGALLNTLMFIFISIPLAENNQRNRKEGFDIYKSETRMLLPIKKFKSERRNNDC